MDIPDLRYFFTVASEGSFSGAAKKLRYAQSNLSLRIKQLEEELQSPLFHRHAHGVSLTGKGEILFSYAEKLLRLAAEAENAVRKGNVSKGTLRIAAMESTAISFLPRLLAEYHRQFPGIRIQVSTGVSEQSLRLVMEGEADGAFVAGPTSHAELRSVEVRRERLTLLTDAAAPENTPLEELLRRPLLVLPRGCHYRKILERWLEDMGIYSPAIMEFDALGAIIASISAGLGVGFIPESAVAAFTSSGVLRSHSVPESYGLVTVRFAWRNDSFMDNGVKSFIELITNYRENSNAV